MTKPMLKKLVVLTVVACMMNATTWAEHVAATVGIRFKGTSTLHGFEGTAPAQPFVAHFTTDEKTGTWKVSARTSLNVKNMTTNNRMRDKNMDKMFDLVHFPRIEAELQNVSISEKADTQAKLHLKIRNVEHEVNATISNVRRKGDRISCIMSFPVSLTAFGMTPPSVMGMIKVKDTVNVECTVTGKISSATER